MKKIKEGYCTCNGNTGDGNTGYENIGDCNTGYGNKGDCNTGYGNKSSFSVGCFNTVELKIILFNKPSDWTYRDWVNSDAFTLLTGGYLKALDESEHGQIWWNGLSEKKRDVIRSIPNFDAAIFEETTGIRVSE